MSEREEKPTVVLDPRTITGPSWPIVLATMEQLGSWTTLAIKLGILAMLSNVVRRMCEPDAPASLVGEAQTLLDALRFMSWEG